ncbi:MAG TPA: hypothetical protein VIF88_06775 [Methylocystis sp.]
MAPFLLAAAIAAICFFWVLAKSAASTGGAESTQSQESPASGKSMLRRLNINRGVMIAGGWAFALGISLTALIEYVLFAYHAPYVLGSLDQFVVILQSSASRQIFWGALFGMVLVVWIDVVTARSRRLPSPPADPDKKNGDSRGSHAQDSPDSLLKSDLLLWVVMLLLFIIGVADYDTVSKTARIVGNVKLPGGVELSLGGKSDRPADTSFAQIVPPVSSQVAAVGAPNTSSGLDNLSESSEATRRDGLFYALKKEMFVQTGAVDDYRDISCQNVTENSSAKTLCYLSSIIKSSQAYGIIGQCVKQYVQIFLDEAGAARALLPIGNYLNDRLLLNIADSDFPLKLNELRDNLKPACKNILNISVSENELAVPYHWIAGAAILAYSHKYAAAINMLNEWLKLNQNINVSNAPSLSDVDLRRIFEIRVRSMISGYIYEWLNREPSVRTQALLDYHADNLRKSILLMEDVVTDISSSLKYLGSPNKLSANNEKLRIENICQYDYIFDNIKWKKIVIDNLGPESGLYRGDRKLDVWRMALSYISTLISLKQTWIDVALSGNDYEKYLYIAQKYADELRAMDMDCMKVINPQDGENYANVMKAESLYWYALVTRAHALSPAEPDQKKERLQSALLVAREGLARVEKRALDQRAYRREESNKAKSCRDIYAQEQLKLFTGEKRRKLASEKPMKKEGDASGQSEPDKCQNDFALRISGTEEIRDVERLSEIIRQLNADLN